MTDSALDEFIGAVTVDCYNDAERATAFYTVFSDEVRFPAAASVMGAAVTVLEIDIGMDGGSLVACCTRGGIERRLALADVEFPADTIAGWLHAAYRRGIGLVPHPFVIPAGWQPNWL